MAVLMMPSMEFILGRREAAKGCVLDKVADLEFITGKDGFKVDSLLGLTFSN